VQSKMTKLLAVVAAIVAVTIAAGIGGVAEAGAAAKTCVIACNQYVRPYYKPSTGTWVQGYWRNSPTDSYRATPYYPSRSYPTYYPSYPSYYSSSSLFTPTSIYYPSYY
jgi:hypothetical protein